MKTTTIIFAITVTVCLITIIDAGEYKRYSNDFLRQRLLDLLLDAKRRGVFDTQLKEAQERTARRRIENFDDDNDEERTYVRRKFVGLSDDPV